MLSETQKRLSEAPPWRKVRPVIRLRNLGFAFALFLAGLLFVARLSGPASAEGQMGPWGDGTWAHIGSDIPPDPAVQFGTLPNGMRYAIMKNATPPGQASIRLRIGAGSLHESDEQQGLAHFLEHMAFKGSTGVPEGEMVKILQRKGLAFGPDNNASTEYTQTVYMLDLPSADASTVQTGLMLMREVASELTLGESAMNSERGVVLSEQRDMDTPQYRATTSLLGQLLEGQLAARRFPIGKTEVIRDAPVSLVRDYYHAYYRPERATLIVVGDIDPARVEAEIKARFADWKAAGPARSDPELGTVNLRGLTVKAVETPGSAAQMHMNWVRPFDPRPISEAKQREFLVKFLALAVLNRRLDGLAHSQNPPFLAAAAEYRSNLARSNESTSITATYNPGTERQALAAIEREQRRLALHGVGGQELEREISAYRTAFENARAGASTRLTATLATALVSSVDADIVFTAPDRDLALFEKTVSGLTVEQVDAAARELFSGAGPLVFVAAPSFIPNVEAELMSEYARSEAEPVAASAAEAEKPWPYASFGTPGEVVERKDISEYGVTFVRFANGVRLSVAPTKHQADQVLLIARIGDGRLAFPKDRPVNDWFSAALVNGGLKSLTAKEIEKLLVSKHFGMTASLDDDAFLLQGFTRPQDLGVQLQVMTAYIVDPAYRAEGFDQVRNQMQSVLTQLEATGNGVLSRDLRGLLRRDDKRWQSPDFGMLSSATVEDVRAALDPMLTGGAIEVAIAGAVTVEDAIELTAATLGALPRRPDPRPVTDDPGIRFPAPPAEPVVLRHKGRPDDSVALAAWPTTDWHADPRMSSALSVAIAALNNRLMEEFRAKEGAAYNVAGDTDMSLSFPGYGYAWAAVLTRPEKAADFLANVSRMAADLREGRVADDDVARAKAPLMERQRRAVQSNEYLVKLAAGAQRDPRRLKLLRSGEELAKVTARDVQEAAARYLTDDRLWKLMVLPSNSAQYSPERSVVK